MCDDSTVLESGAEVDQGEDSEETPLSSRKSRWSALCGMFVTTVLHDYWELRLLVQHACTTRLMVAYVGDGFLSWSLTFLFRILEKSKNHFFQFWHFGH